MRIIPGLKTNPRTRMSNSDSGEKLREPELLSRTRIISSTGVQLFRLTMAT